MSIMLWRGRRGSSNVDDRRGISDGGIAAGGGIIGVIIYLTQVASYREKEMSINKR